MWMLNRVDNPHKNCELPDQPHNTAQMSQKQTTKICLLSKIRSPARGGWKPVPESRLHIPPPPGMCWSDCKICDYRKGFNRQFLWISTAYIPEQKNFSGTVILQTELNPPPPFDMAPSKGKPTIQGMLSSKPSRARESTSGWICCSGN